MAVLNVFFVASRADVDALDIRRDPNHQAAESPLPKRRWLRGSKPARAEPVRSEFPSVDATGILDVEWATLETLLHDEPVGDIDAVVALVQKPLRFEPQERPECWLSPVSDRLVGALAVADSGRLREVVGPWLRTDELAGRGVSEDNAVQLLTRLHELCARARRENLGVYRWFSL